MTSVMVANSKCYIETINFIYSCMLQSHLLLLFIYFEVYEITNSLILFTVFHL